MEDSESTTPAEPGETRGGVAAPGSAIQGVEAAVAGLGVPGLIERPEWAVGTCSDPSSLIHGDSQQVLPRLAERYEARARCVYIDPPFNTGGRFEQYEDARDHASWLEQQLTCAAHLRRMLRPDGSLWMHLDDHEVHYAKVELDRLFGRECFMASIVWQKVFARKNKAQISNSHDTILVYARDPQRWRRNLMPRTAQQKQAYKNPDSDPRGPWQSVSYSVQSEDGERRAQYRYAIVKPSGGEVWPPPGRHWNGGPERTAQLLADGRLWFGPAGDRRPRLKVFMSEVQGGIVPDSWWNHGDCGHNQEAKKELLALFPRVDPFATPKPERLLYRVLSIATDPGDLVIDCFAGSGTTGAVAHKLGRKWLMIEKGSHCRGLIHPRLQKVVCGQDLGGISEIAGFRGGGGFRYFEAPDLL